VTDPTSQKRYYFGFFKGRIEDNVDPRNLGRLKVRVPEIHGPEVQIPNDQLPWARPAFKGQYAYDVPDPDGVVWVGFEHGLADKPVWFGCLPLEYEPEFEPVPPPVIGPVATAETETTGTQTSQAQTNTGTPTLNGVIAKSSYDYIIDTGVTSFQFGPIIAFLLKWTTNKETSSPLCLADTENGPKPGMTIEFEGGKADGFQSVITQAIGNKVEFESIQYAPDIGSVYKIYNKGNPPIPKRLRTYDGTGDKSGVLPVGKFVTPTRHAPYSKVNGTVNKETKVVQTQAISKEPGGETQVFENNQGGRIELNATEQSAEVSSAQDVMIRAGKNTEITANDILLIDGGDGTIIIHANKAISIVAPSVTINKRKVRNDTTDI